MAPNPVKNNPRDTGLVYAEPLCDGLLANPALSIKPAHSSYVLVLQSGLGMSFAMDRVLGCVVTLPSLSEHVGGVVGGCSNEEMGWPNTRFVVTLVTDEQPSWYRPNMQLPREAMREETLPGELKSTISVGSELLEIPAFPGFADQSPEAFFLSGFHKAIYHGCVPTHSVESDWVLA